MKGLRALIKGTPKGFCLLFTMGAYNKSATDKNPDLVFISSLQTCEK